MIDRLSPPVRAAVWMTLAAVAFAGLSILIRLAAAEGMHAFVIAFWRTGLAFLWMTPWLLRVGPTERRAALRWRWGYVFRAAFGVVGMLGSFYALANMPMADAVAINFATPLFTTIGAALFLGEIVRLRRWTATLLGFLGVLVVVPPGPALLTPAALAAILGAAGAAGALLMVKKLSNSEPAPAIVFNMGLYLTPMLAPFALFYWSWPTPLGWLWLGLLGLSGTLAHVALTRAFQAADASLAMPFDYLRLPFAAAGAAVLFNEIPELRTFVGAAIIAGATVYIARREAAVRRDADAAAPLKDPP